MDTDLHRARYSNTYSQFPIITVTHACKLSKIVDLGQVHI